MQLRNPAGKSSIVAFCCIYPKCKIFRCLISIKFNDLPVIENNRVMILSINGNPDYQICNEGRFLILFLLCIIIAFEPLFIF